MSAARPRDVAQVFLQLGATAFGGPAAHTAMMHEQVVRRRGWLSDAEFADLLAAAQIIPGPNSTELAIYIGRRVAGWRGLAVAGACFILPAASITAVLAVLYVRYGSTPDARALLAGMAPVVFAVITHALWSVSRAMLRSPRARVIAVVAAGAALAGINELIILAGAALAMIPRGTFGVAAVAGVSCLSASVSAYFAGPGTVPPRVPLTALTLTFLKIGSVLFGSGYVLIAFLRADFVDRWHWLTDQQLLDAVAIGQFTPGPLFSTATFIGYVLAGWMGAVLSTIAIFLPGFVLVALTHPILSRLRRSPIAAACLDGVVAASLGLMAAVAVPLARTTLVAPAPCALAIVAIAALAWGVNSAWLMIAGAVIGMALWH